MQYIVLNYLCYTNNIICNKKIINKIENKEFCIKIVVRRSYCEE